MLGDYYSTPFLRKIRTPVLFVVGQYDVVNLETLNRLASVTPGARGAAQPGSPSST